MTVINFPTKEETEEHITSPCKCASCGHKWQVVAPVGTYEFECPSCGLMKGVLTHFVVPDVLWRCECDSELFYIGESRLYCAKCGAEPVLD